MSVRLSFLASLGSFLILLLTSSFASSAECDRREPHVVVNFSDNWDQGSKKAVLSDLTAALAPKSMGACTGAQSRDNVVAQISVERAGLRVTIDVDDALTNKRVSRDVKLNDASDSSSALLVAVAIDELLRATWAELSMAKKEPEPKPVVESEPVVERKPEPERDPEPFRFPVHRVALRGSVESFVLASTFLGGDIVYGSSFLDTFEWSAFAGPRLVRSDRATGLGRVGADAVTFGAELSLPVIATPRFFFGPQLSMSATHAWFFGDPDSTEPNVEGARLAGWGVVSRGGIFGRLHVGPAYVAAATRVGAPLVALEVTDGSEVVGGLTGLEWSNSLMLGWWWR